MTSRGRYDAVVAPQFLEDLRSWVETDKRVALRIIQLMDAILRDPFTGIGKPEPLKYIFAGSWSRRITQEHRLVYRVSAGRIEFYQAKYHYTNEFPLPPGRQQGAIPEGGLNFLPGLDA